MFLPSGNNVATCNSQRPHPAAGVGQAQAESGSTGFSRPGIRRAFIHGGIKARA